MKIYLDNYICEVLDISYYGCSSLTIDPDKLLKVGYNFDKLILNTIALVRKSSSKLTLTRESTALPGWYTVN